nr:hypothetical protein [uncultured Blautia sp.]
MSKKISVKNLELYQKPARRTLMSMRDIGCLDCFIIKLTSDYCRV